MPACYPIFSPPRRRLPALVALGLALGACQPAPLGPVASVSGYTPPGGGPYGGYEGSASGSALGAAFGARGGAAASSTTPSGGRVVLLVPLTGPRGDLASALARAAQMPLDGGPGTPPLDVKDTGGTPEGAARAATEAIAGGAGLLLGPLTAAETAAVAPVAQAAHVGVLAFTNDASQARPGVWVLGITPGQQVRRLLAATQAKGLSRPAGLFPENDFGRAMEAALRDGSSALGLTPPITAEYAPGSMNALNGAVRTVSGYASRRGPIDAAARAARERGDAEGRREAAEINKRGVPPPPFDSLLLADTGGTLAEVAALLPYYDVDRGAAKLMGPALWAAPASGSGQFPGAWYAAPDPATRGAFDAAYQAKYGAPAPPIADLAYDAAGLARAAAASGGFSQASLTAQLYAGADGTMALDPDGTVRRALAVFQVDRGGGVLVDPAPQAPGS